MVAAARNGQKALEMVIRKPPDLVLLDIMMPEMDGYEVCRRIKENESTKNIPVIFITALNQAMDEARAFNIGAADYITKPFHPLVAKARVDTHLELKKKNDMLEALVFLDGLTSVHNRRKFDETLVREWKLATRNMTPLSLILMDIDHFKQYNDNYGHANGDKCLTKVADGLKNAINRPSDFLGRYGGEEFVVILPDTELKGALHVAENLRQAVVDLNIPHQYSPIAPFLSLSVGVASFQPMGTPKMATDLIETADNMLYKSKENGRNQVNGIRM